MHAAVLQVHILQRYKCTLQRISKSVTVCKYTFYLFRSTHFTALRLYVLQCYTCMCYKITSTYIVAFHTHMLHYYSHVHCNNTSTGIPALPTHMLQHFNYDHCSVTDTYIATLKVHLLRHITSTSVTVLYIDTYVINILSTREIASVYTLQWYACYSVTSTWVTLLQMYALQRYKNMHFSGTSKLQYSSLQLIQDNFWLHVFGFFATSKFEKWLWLPSVYS